MSQTLPIALQLYTLRILTERDAAAALRAVRQIGYRFVELAGFGSHTPLEFAELLRDAGLCAIAAHVPMETLESSPARVASEHRPLGVLTLVMPWIEPSQRQSADDWRHLAHRLNEVGAALADNGCSLLYHNHDFEFHAVEGTTGFDILLEEADPRYVNFEFDIYWAAFARLDPIDVMKKIGPRLRSLHLKDMSSVDRRFAPLGKGTLDLAGILEFADIMNLQFAAIEQDETFEDPPLDAVRESFEYLKTLSSP